MRVRVDGVVRAGRAVDCRPLDVDARTLAATIRDESRSGVAVDCPDPSPVHEYVGHVHAGMGLPVRAALAAVARGRGLTAPQDDELAAVEAELASLDPPPVDLAEPRERLAAAAEADVAGLRESVAARRGELAARRSLDAEAAPAAERLEAAAAGLAEAETDRVAARQAFEQARGRARDARDARERRLHLQDRAGNLRRAAREHLAGALGDEFATALAAVPGDGSVPGRPSTFEGDPVAAALAVARLADLRAPVVVADGRFETPGAAAATLDAPVVLC
jgi:hypothetical protein